jgi:Outer membrane cytochrome MtrC/MtrF-like, domains II/IV/Cytochrome c552
MHKKLLPVSILIVTILAACTSAAPVSPQTSSRDSAVSLLTVMATPTISPLDCKGCHDVAFSNWQSGAHFNTQSDVAKELSQLRIGQTPDDVLHGPDAKDCIVCHAPRAVVLAGTVISETEAMNRFFNTSDGKYTVYTQSINATDWPDINCATCHNVPAEHKDAKLTFSFFNSQTAQYVSLSDSNQVCGQCHGSALVPGRDDQTYDAWKISKHSSTQEGVVQVYRTAFNGQTPEQVANEGEDCIACHAPTAVLTNGGMSEVEATAYFYTTTDGKFSADTTIDHASDWPNVSCTACHDPHNPSILAYFNSSTGKYQPIRNNNELCGQCHGNLRFTNSIDLSYNIISGTGGVGVPDQQMEPNVGCTDCHMYSDGVHGSKSAMLGGHTWAITVTDANGQTTTSCTHCHSDMDTAKSQSIIKQFQSDFQDLDARAKSSVQNADAAMQGVTTADLLGKLKEAHTNLTYAEADESKGYHNHTYLMALLTDSVQRSQEILTALGK